MPLYCTRDGASRLLKRRDDLKKRIADLQGTQGENAEVGGNDWHDNFAFEQTDRDVQALNRTLGDMNAAIRDVQVVDPPRTTDRVQIGHVIHLRTEDDELKVYQVGGYEEGDMDHDPPIVAYLAPLIRPFMNEAPGFEVQVRLPGGVKEVMLEEIRMP